MQVNKDSDTVVLHKDIYAGVMSRLESLSASKYLIDQTNKHARKFNEHLAYSHKAKTLERQTQSQLLNKKLHILMRLRRQAHARGEKFIVWRRMDDVFYSYALIGVMHTAKGNPSKRLLKLETTRISSSGETTFAMVVHISQVHVEWSDELDSYTSSIINAGLNLGYKPSILTDKGYRDTLGRTALVNEDYGLIGFQEDPNTKDNPCLSL